jgi:uncharacterized delta-60 repeat protein
MKHSFRLLLLILICNIFTFAQGELDTSFGSSGAFRIPNSSFGQISDSAIQEDGKIVSLGACRDTIFANATTCLVRLNNDGVVDTTFGNWILAGHNRITIPGLNIFSEHGSPSIINQNDGKIVVLAYGSFAGLVKTFLIRFNSNGSLDTGFGNQGFKELSEFPGIEASEMQVQPDGKLVVIGGSYVVRYLPNGNTDTTFGGNGVFTINNSIGTAIELRNDGKLVIGGNTNSQAFIGRINANGTLDTSFGVNGYSIITGITGIKTLSLSVDNKIVALGSQNIIYRLTINGSVDTTFNGSGFRPVFGADNIFSANDLIVTGSGKITVVGHRIPVFNQGLPLDYMISRFVSNGMPDTTFSGDGHFELPINGVDEPRNIISDRNGRMVVSGLSAQSAGFNPYEFLYFSIARLAASPVQNVPISGRVVNANGRAVIAAYIVLKRGSEIIAQTRTNPFGYFRFNNIQTNETYAVSTRSKGLSFSDQSIMVDDRISDLQIMDQ